MLRLKPEDLEKYTDKDGNIRFEDDVIFEGDLYCRGNLYCSGNLYCRGNLDCRGYLYCSGNLDCRGYLDCSGNLDCRGNLYCRGYLDCSGEYLIIRGTLYWSHTTLPNIPEQHYIKLIMPQPWQREHYVQRLGFELVGCYEDIRKQVGRKVFNLLKDEKWLPIERKMLELIRDYDKPVPDWMQEVMKPEQAQEATA